MTTYRLYGTQAKNHDRIAGQRGDFDRTVEAMQNHPPGREATVTVGLSRYNFFEVDAILRLACDLLDRRFPADWEDFSVEPVGGVYTRFNRHMKRLIPVLHDLGMEVEFADRDLSAILRNIERVEGPTNRNDLLRLLGIFADRAFVGPKRLLVDPLYACNLDCVYCNNFSAPRRNVTRKQMEDDPYTAMRDKVLDFETFASVMDQAARMGVEAVSLVGGGEPLLHPRFLDMLDLATGKGFAVDVSTNGILLEGEAARRIAAASPDSVTFSISAATPESYGLLHPGNADGVFERVCANARGLADEKRRLGAERPTLIALHVINRVNMHEAVAMVERSAELGFDEVWLQMVHVRDFCLDLAVPAERLEELRPDVERARKRAAELGIAFSSYINFQMGHISSDGTWSGGDFVDDGCLVGWTFSLLTCGGDVSLCCGWKFIDNLEGKSYEEIWNSEKYARVRRAARFLGRVPNMRMANGKMLLDEFCYSCDNHNLNREVFDLLEEYDLLRYLDPPSPLELEGDGEGTEPGEGE